jgi:hypothetical protein
MPHDGSSALVLRLFGVRDVALGLALHPPSADLRRAALQVGVAVDAADVAAGLVGIRSGAPRSTLLGWPVGPRYSSDSGCWHSTSAESSRLAGGRSGSNRGSRRG